MDSTRKDMTRESPDPKLRFGIEVEILIQPKPDSKLYELCQLNQLEGSGQPERRKYASLIYQGLAVLLSVAGVEAVAEPSNPTYTTWIVSGDPSITSKIEGYYELILSLMRSCTTAIY